ncbi:MAG: NAD(P)-dependent glycerol-3-phosphate dehydrogenase [Alphaproteobacteria bacterium]|nr:MAG: NAD(P)-dependent glycerol-3-phosphate dehydrogenase [Alphaproteobacteria bacterium]
MKKMETVAVLGAGAWGTALAVAIARAGKKPVLWARNAAVVDDIQKNRRNEKYLPGQELPPMPASCDLSIAKDTDAILIAVPAQQIRAVCGVVRPHVAKSIPILIAAKGIETGTDLLVTDIAGEFFPDHPLAVLSGPNFADEVAKGLPTATTIACADEAIGKSLLDVFGSQTLRPYWTADVIGTCIGGSLKNVIAIAAGVVAGKDLGDNARAALVTRGLAEIGRLAAHMGANPQTLMGLSGMGDLMLTCYGEKSRNFRYGFLMGKGASPTEAKQKISATIEGIETARAVCELAQKKSLELPISMAVNALISGKISVQDAMNGLLNRPLKQE